MSYDFVFRDEEWQEFTPCCPTEDTEALARAGLQMAWALAIERDRQVIEQAAANYRGAESAAVAEAAVSDDSFPAFRADMRAALADPEFRAEAMAPRGGLGAVNCVIGDSGAGGSGGYGVVREGPEPSAGAREAAMNYFYNVAGPSNPVPRMPPRGRTLLIEIAATVLLLLVAGLCFLLFLTSSPPLP